MPGHANVAIQTIHDNTDPVAVQALKKRVYDRLCEPKLQTSDILMVAPISVLDVHVKAVLDVPFGPDGALIEAEAKRRFKLLQEYVEKPRRILSLSAITSALHAANVTRVRLLSPAADVIPAPGQRVAISAFDLTMERTNG